MALKCDICGKGRTIGKSGSHKYGGGWAMRAHKTKRIWRPNLQQCKVNGQKMKLCTKCLKRVKFEQRKKAEQLAKVKKELVVEKPQKEVPKKTSKSAPKKKSLKSSKKSA